jgi:hypothetical protein
MKHMDITTLRKLIEAKELPEWNISNVVTGAGWCATWELVRSITVHYEEIDGWSIFRLNTIRKSDDITITEDKAVTVLKAYMQLAIAVGRALEENNG